MADIMTHSPLVLRPDPSHTVLRPFEPEDADGDRDPKPSRAHRIGTWCPQQGFAAETPSGLGIAPRIEQHDIPDDGSAEHVTRDGGTDLSKTVLFPVTPAQRCGVADMRLVRFEEDDGSVRRLGFHTALDDLLAELRRTCRRL